MWILILPGVENVDFNSIKVGSAAVTKEGINDKQLQTLGDNIYYTFVIFLRLTKLVYF